MEKIWREIIKYIRKMIFNINKIKIINQSYYRVVKYKELMLNVGFRMLRT